MLLCTEHKLFSKTYILCIQRFGSSTVSFTAREYTYITWGYYLMGQALVLGTFLRAIAHAYCTLVPREVSKVLPRLNDLVTEFYFYKLYKQQRRALTVTNVMLHPLALVYAVVAVGHYS